MILRKITLAAFISALLFSCELLDESGGGGEGCEFDYIARLLFDLDGDGRCYFCCAGQDCDEESPAHWHDCGVCVDEDGDGYGVDGSLCDLPEDDCEDADVAFSPEAEEICDNCLNEDCDAFIDEGCGTIMTEADGNAVPGLNSKVSGIIDPFGDQDDYYVYLCAGQRVGFDVDANEYGSDLESWVRLYSPSGVELYVETFGTDPDTGLIGYDSYVSHLVTEEGTYRFRIEDFEGWACGSNWYCPYDLLIRQEPP